jgi:hypothetical protein
MPPIGDIMKLVTCATLLLLVSPLAAAHPQGLSSGDSGASAQQESLAEAAERAKAQKKQEPKATKVWDNDNIPTAGGNISVVGQANQTTPQTEKSEKKSAAATPAEKAELQAKLDDAKAQLASLKVDLNIAQRKYALDENTYLSNPNHAHDTAGADALEDEKQQIADKQQEISDAEKKVDDLQAKLDAANSSQSE